MWVPQAKRMHQIVRIDFESYFFSTTEGAHSSQTPPVSTDAAEVLPVLNLGAPSFKKSWIGPRDELTIN